MALKHPSNTGNSLGGIVATHTHRADRRSGTLYLARLIMTFGSHRRVAHAARKR